MIQAGVIGWPVSHSLSPRLHGYWLAQYGIRGDYRAFKVAPENLTQRLKGLAAEGIRGVNLTLPHKQAALGLMTGVSPAAQAIGAVNTVIVGDNGTLAGDNTDAFGFMENLREAAAPELIKSAPAVVIGAGGAARAVCYALLAADVSEIRLINRTVSHAEALASMDRARIMVSPWSARAKVLDGAALLVNTTTLGMTGRPALDLDLAALPFAALVTDIVYTPLETPLLTAALGRGNPVIDGLGMLLHQARPGFAAWFGVMPEVTPALRAHVLAGEL